MDGWRAVRNWACCGRRWILTQNLKSIGLYFGPLRMRVDHIHQAVLKEFEDEYGHQEA
jgi:hypothetical protein